MKKHKAAGLPPAPSWHELVKPGPKGSEKRRQERLEAQRRGTFTDEFFGPNRAERRASGQIPHPGRLVLHRTRLYLTPGGGGERLSVLRRRAERAARALADEVAA